MSKEEIWIRVGGSKVVHFIQDGAVVCGKKMPSFILCNYNRKVADIEIKLAQLKKSVPLEKCKRCLDIRERNK